MQNVVHILEIMVASYYDLIANKGPSASDIIGYNEICVDVACTFILDVKKIGNFNADCTLCSPTSNWAATAEKELLGYISPFPTSFRNCYIAKVTKRFPVPTDVSRKKRRWGVVNEGSRSRFSVYELDSNASTTLLKASYSLNLNFLIEQ